MIVNRGDILHTSDGLFICDSYINNKDKNWSTYMEEYQSGRVGIIRYRRVCIKDINKVVTKEENPEYFL